MVAAARGAGRGVGLDPRPAWPEVDERAVVEQTREVPIQVNGKLRDKVTVPAGISEIELEQIVLARDKVVDGDRRRARGAGHPRRRRQARQHRPARLSRLREPAGSRRRLLDRPEVQVPLVADWYIVSVLPWTL